MQKILDKDEFITKKNGFLQPLYRDLKAQIKNMTHTPEYKLLKEYIRNRNLIIQALPENSTKAQEGVLKLKAKYATLLKNHETRMETDVSLRLKVTQKRVEDMFQLLNIWQ